jgi:hypothetical protein
MTIIYSLIAAIICGAVGAALGFGIAAMVAPFLGITNFEGAASYFAFLIGAPIGALLGIVLGAIVILRRRGTEGVGAVTGKLGVVIVSLGVLAAGVLGLFFLTQDIVNPTGVAPQLVFEIRLPAGATPPGGEERPIELQTNKNRMTANMDRAATRDDGGRPVIVGLVEMYYRTTQRMLVVNMPDKTDIIFNIKLRRTPKHSAEFSPWQRADFIGEPGQAQPRRATAADNYEIRYRTEWAGHD